MDKLLAAVLLLGLSSAVSARERDVSRYLEDNVCTAYLFTAAHSQLSLKSPDALWIILNMGPSDVIISTRNAPIAAVFKPWSGKDTNIFFGDTRYRYILSLAPNGQDTKVYVCVPK